VEVSLDPGAADGVLVATVWDDKGKPLAERLVFRQPAKALSIELTADKKTYVPGDTVKLTARATLDGKPVSAVLGLTVTDDSVLEMIERREQAPDLPVMAFLEPEVQELADAHVYLDPNNPKAPVATDLLLGTQGWRRFALMDLPTFLSQHGDSGRRALAIRVVTQLEVTKSAQLFAVDEMGAGGPPGMAARMEGAVNEAPPPQAVAPMPPPAPAPEPPAEERAPVMQAPAQPLGDEKQQALADKLDEAEVRASKKKIMAGVPARSRAAAVQWVTVREYAHALRAGRKPTDRIDFAETLYWNAARRTDAKGEATFTFALNDSVTSFKAAAGAFAESGALGSRAIELESVQPFYLEAKLPLEVTQGDRIQLPVALVNGTGEPLRGVKLDVQAKGEVQVAQAAAGDLRAAERARRLVALDVRSGKVPVEMTFAASAGAYADQVTRPLSVKPNGFPFRIEHGGMIGANKTVAHKVTIPAGMVPGSVTSTVAVYPTPLANLTEGLARLIQDPYGCFEQTSSTSYPLTMAQQYFLTHTGVDPKLVATAREKLDAGYKRLVGFECSEKGYEWFGENPGHEALTAYGLMHFTDMAQVREVDPKMLASTRTWLLKQRDGKGGFERKRRALHTWIEDKDCSNAYILWALMESGEKDLAKELASLKEAAGKSQNSYVVALAANVMALAGDKAEAKRLMDRLAAKQDKDGKVQGATQSIVGSGGEALEIEATSLAVLAWLRDPAYAANVERAMKFVADSCQGGRYGSTQSTVLALRAVVAYDKARARPKAAGSVRVYVDGQPVGSAVKFDPSTQGAIKLPDIFELLGKGEHKVELKMVDGSEMPYSISVGYHALTPDSAKECKVALDVKLAKATVAEGELVEAMAVVTNRTSEPIPTPVAIVGLPGGLEPRHDQLKELVKKGTVDAYEVIGRDVVLYWRGMKPGQKAEVPLSLVAAIPGAYTGPASRAYLYYTDEHKVWVDGLKVEIDAK
jgi:alpha-2-macroglobulin-like protein